MKLIIDIPKEAYELLQNDGVDWLGAEHILNAVANGVLLPKGHGRLIDEDQIPGDGGWDFSDRLMSTPTIIEADKSAESEDRND